MVKPQSHALSQIPCTLPLLFIILLSALSSAPVPTHARQHAPPPPSPRQKPVKAKQGGGGNGGQTPSRSPPPSPPPPSVQPQKNVCMGTQTIGANNSATGAFDISINMYNTALQETAAGISVLGSNILKICVSVDCVNQAGDFSPGSATSSTELAVLAPIKSVMDLPFSYILMWVSNLPKVTTPGTNGHSWSTHPSWTTGLTLEDAAWCVHVAKP